MALPADIQFLTPRGWQQRPTGQIAFAKCIDGKEFVEWRVPEFTYDYGDLVEVVYNPYLSFCAAPMRMIPVYRDWLDARDYIRMDKIVHSRETKDLCSAKIIVSTHGTQDVEPEMRELVISFLALLYHLETVPNGIVVTRNNHELFYDWLKKPLYNTDDEVTYLPVEAADNIFNTVNEEAMANIYQRLLPTRTKDGVTTPRRSFRIPTILQEQCQAFAALSNAVAVPYMGEARIRVNTPTIHMRKQQSPHRGIRRYQGERINVMGQVITRWNHRVAVL